MKKILIGIVTLYSFAHLVHGVFGYDALGDWRLPRENVQNWIQAGAFQGLRPTSNSFDYTTASPLHALLVTPLVFLAEKPAAGLNLAINFILMGFVFYWASFSVAKDKKALWWPLSIALIFNFRPFLLGMAMVKIEFVELFLLALAIHLFRKNKDYGCGAALGVATLIKYVPGIFLLFFIAKKEWKVVTGFFMAMFATTIPTLLIFGWEHHASFAVQLLSKQSWTSWIDNQSMGMAISRLFLPFPPTSYFPEIDLGTGFALLLWGIRVFLAGFLFHLTRKKIVNRESRGWIWEAALWLGFAPVLLHFFRDYYLMLLVPFMLEFVGDLVEKPPQMTIEKTFWFGLLAAYLLVGQGFPLGVFTRLPEFVPHYSNFNLFLYLSIPFWGIAIYLVVLSWGLTQKVICRT